MPKLMDANWAASGRSEECTLILTEGDSAKSLVVSGLSDKGRNTFGVFPLRCCLSRLRAPIDRNRAVEFSLINTCSKRQTTRLSRHSQYR